MIRASTSPTSEPTSRSLAIDQPPRCGVDDRTSSDSPCLHARTPAHPTPVVSLIPYAINGKTTASSHDLRRYLPSRICLYGLRSMHNSECVARPARDVFC